MPQNYFGRVLLILGITLLAVLAILPPGSLFDSSVPWSKKLNLKPGIDMAGGTKLVYEIKAPADEAMPGDLAEQVMSALKKRVDPDGVRNLVWRPQGGNRLEIQMPLGNQSEESQQARANFSAAQSALEKTNIRRSEVLRAVERLTGDARRDKLNELAMGSPEREKLFGGLAAAYDRVKQAETSGDEAARAQTEEDYDNLKGQIEDTNLTAGELQEKLEGQPDARKERIEQLKQRSKDFPERLEAIDHYVTAWEAYSGLKGQLDDAGELKRLLRGSGVLEFHMLVESNDLMSPDARAMIDRLNAGGKGITPQAGDEMRWYEVDRPNEMQANLVREYNGRFYALAWTTREKSMVNRPGEPRWALKRAYRAQSELGVRAVGFEFDAQGAANFSELTSANLKKLMSVMLDDKIISAATIQSVIGSTGTITRESGYTDSEFNYLINTLNAGSLPAQLAEEPISEQTVGPQLGQDNLRLGLYTCLFGLVIVGIFLIGYYYSSGMVAMVAVLMNVVLILGFMAAFDATFTLPGVAAIVLTIGCAVDANVLIFERLREEQMRGMGLAMALRNAYDRAFSAIVDSNVTTAITAAVLYWAGSEEVKGFGLTLLLGMLSSMFTALFVTKTIFGLMIEKGGVKKLGSLPLTFPKWDRMLRPDINWMGMAKWCYAFSLTFIVVGGAAFLAKWNANEMLDVEFVGGTTVQFELKQAMRIEDVRDRIEKYSVEHKQQLPSPLVYSVGSGGVTYELVTANEKGKEVKEAIVTVLGEDLKAERESTFAGVRLPIDEAMREQYVLPVSDQPLQVGDKVVEDASAHAGGVAVILKNLEPPISVEEIARRMEKQRLQPQPGGQLLPYRDTDVEVVEAAPGGLARSAVVLVSDSKYPFEKDEAKWQEELASPTWRLINDAINNPAQLERVTNIDGQIAGATQLRALIALVLSTIAIMIYIWFRFGDMKFGTAGTIATLHDTFFVLAAVGFAHYISETEAGRALLIEPFRINLTMVAAILTVMGYSMNDTVVVFDRIRENRGKFGAVNAKVVNDSINQTLSRTLLTGGTTIITIFVMYLFGGSGIHGFTFALLVGIVIGTYSSIAIASPLLLVRAHREESAEKKRPTTLAQPS